MEAPTETWRQDPTNSEIRISDLGRVQTWETRNKRWSPIFVPNPTKNGYVYFVHRGKRHAVHQIVARAFIGPCPDGHSVDHIKKCDGDFVRERSDNRATNLRYLLAMDQLVNRRGLKPRCDGRPVLVWKVGDVEANAVCYTSTHKAATELGLDEGNARQVARGKRLSIKGYKLRFDDPAEPDRVAADEEFRLVRGKFEVSQYGRMRATRGQGFVYTPKIGTGHRYVSVGTNVMFHHLVAEAWPDIVGERPTDMHNIDHVDRNPANNAATNLRWLTQSEQLKNQDRLPAHLLSNVRKVAVDFRPPGGAWQQAQSMHEAARMVSEQVGFRVRDSLISRKTAAEPYGSSMLTGPLKGWGFRLRA